MLDIWSSNRFFRMDRKNQKKVPITLIFQSSTQQFLHLFFQSAILIEFFAEKKCTKKNVLFSTLQSTTQMKTRKQEIDQPFLHCFDNSITKRLVEKFSQLFVKVLLWSQKTEISQSFQTKKTWKFCQLF